MTLRLCRDCSEQGLAVASKSFYISNLVFFMEPFIVKVDSRQGQ